MVEVIEMRSDTARLAGLVRSDRAIRGARYDRALDRARERAHDDRVPPAQRSPLAPDSRGCGALGLGLPRESGRSLRGHAHRARRLRLLLHAARSRGDGRADHRGEAALGPGAEPFDYWVGKPGTESWRHVPDAARKAFPGIARIIGRASSASGHAWQMSTGARGTSPRPDTPSIEGMSEREQLHPKVTRDLAEQRSSGSRAGRGLQSLQPEACPREVRSVSMKQAADVHEARASDRRRDR